MLSERNDGVCATHVWAGVVIGASDRKCPHLPCKSRSLIRLSPRYFFARAFLTTPTSIMIAMPPTPDPATLPLTPLAAPEARTAVSS